MFFGLCQISLMQAFDVQGRVAYYYPEDNRMRNIYGKKGWAEYEIEASTPLMCCCECSCDWEYFANLGYFEKSGRSTCLNDKTKVTNWAFNIGVKRYFDIFECVRPYLGLGAGAAHVRFHDQSDFVRQHTKRWGVAILAKSGFQYDLTCNMFLDLFADYSYHWFNFQHHSGVTVRNVNTGGLKLGLGLGYKF